MAKPGRDDDWRWELHWALRAALPPWLGTRVALLAATAAAGALLVPRVTNTPVHPPAAASLGWVVSRWTLWDGNLYWRIASADYPRPFETAFFPLYPLLVRVVTWPLPLSHPVFLAAGLLVSNLAALAAFALVAALAGPYRRAAVRLLAAYPLALFLAATYSDALFLALAAGALLAARRHAWAWAAACAFLAGLTRPTAVVLVPALAWEYAAWARSQAHGAQGEGWRAMWRWREGVELAATVPAAIALYAGFCWLHWGDPLAFLHAEATTFGHAATWPWATVALVARQVATMGPLGSYRSTRLLVDVLPVAAALVGTAVGWRGRPMAWNLYLAGLLALIFCSPVVVTQFPDALTSAGRYLLAAVPLWVDLARWAGRRPWLEETLVVGGLMVQAVLVAFVVTGGWLV